MMKIILPWGVHVDDDHGNILAYFQAETVSKVITYSESELVSLWYVGGIMCELN